MKFKLISKFKPTGDQPQAIKELVSGFNRGLQHQTLLGVTGSGKTFTVANVIEKLNIPTLVLSHNKTLAAQLYSEFKSFFPDNAVEYFISYYDYYQPEAYIASSDTYIEKDIAINQEIEKMRLRATASLLSGRNDVIVVSSVSCIYGMANPNAFSEKIIYIKEGDKYDIKYIQRRLVENYYKNDKITFEPGFFRVKGDVLDVYPMIEGYDGVAYKLEFWDGEIEGIYSFNPKTGKEISRLNSLVIHPANLFVTTQEQVNNALSLISVDLGDRVTELEEENKYFEAKRLYERVTFDMEMIRELGYCSGIENYSRYFDGRSQGEQPYCLFDYFPDDFLLIIDESHVTIPQIRAMYAGDRSRKINLVDYGFRLPAALDNRPLKFDEFETFSNKTIYISATPADYELEKSGGAFIDQVIRPTGLLDPPIIIKETTFQVDDLQNEILKCIDKDERVLVTTLTKRMAEELASYLTSKQISCTYIHSEVDTLDRIKIMESLRSGHINVLIGVNLLREGLDLPEVALVAVLDADKEGFLRSYRSLTQTAGRAARNINGRVIFYADTITDSIKKTLDETNRRRDKQIKYNEENNITPKQIVKNSEISIWNKDLDIEKDVLDKGIDRLSKDELLVMIEDKKKQMTMLAKDLDFLNAAKIRDEIRELEKMI